MNWEKIAAFGEEALLLAGPIAQAIEQDKADASTETKTQLAAQTLVQTSTIAQAVDPNDTETIQGLTALAGTIISALKTTPPVAATAA